MCDEGQQRVWQQPNQSQSMVTPMISFGLPASFREQEEANDICRPCQGSAHVVVSEQADCWRLSKAVCVCVCVQEQDTPCGGIQ